MTVGDATEWRRCQVQTGTSGRIDGVRFLGPRWCSSLCELGRPRTGSLAQRE